VNKKRNGEVDDLRAQLVGAQGRVSAAEADARKRVAAAEAVAAELGERNGWVGV
jgi:hypothetical protein